MTVFQSDPAPLERESCSAFGALRQRVGLGPACALAAALLVGACATSSEKEPPAPAPVASAEERFGGALSSSPELDEAAALLCARDTDAVIDVDLRRATGLVDGIAVGVLRRHQDAKKAHEDALREADALAGAISATHRGLAEGSLAGGQACTALILVKRLVEPPDFRVERLLDEPLYLRASGQFAKESLFVTDPFGRTGSYVLDNDKDLTLSWRSGPGRYVLELVVDRGDDDPEIAWLWPLVVGGMDKSAADPKVLFPDEGHSDKALGYRAATLVARLRDTLEREPLRIAPPLESLAKARAEALSRGGTLGHRLPSGLSPKEHAQADVPGFHWARLAEVQAQAGTLSEAWTALLESPAHRHVLVDKGLTHMGVGFSRGKDALGRHQVTVLVLAARQVSRRDVRELATELTGRLNLARHQKGHAPLKAHPELQRLAEEQAAAMREQGSTKGDLLGQPVAQRALEQTDLPGVRAVLAALDDPLRLAPSAATLAPEMGYVGVGMVPGGPGGRWMLCVLVGEAGE